MLSAYTVREAQVLFEREDIDLIISDITLPEGNGLDFGKSIREKSDVYFIYLAAMDQETDNLAYYNKLIIGFIFDEKLCILDIDSNYK